MQIILRIFAMYSGVRKRCIHILDYENIHDVERILTEIFKINYFPSLLIHFVRQGWRLFFEKCIHFYRI